MSVLGSLSISPKSGGRKIVFSSSTSVQSLFILWIFCKVVTSSYWRGQVPTQCRYRAGNILPMIYLQYPADWLFTTRSHTSNCPSFSFPFYTQCEKGHVQGACPGGVPRSNCHYCGASKECVQVQLLLYQHRNAF